MGDTITAMTEWDEIGLLTRGEKPLYHMQLCPDAKYPVTDEQWKRMAELALEEIGAKGHDYELYFHPGVKDDGEPDKPHAHLGVCRTNRDTLKMLDLSYNYVAHERASKRIALEFGWELVPGKHAKRDRKKQKEFPRQRLTKDEDQYQQRTGLSKDDRIREIAALHAAADTGPAFKAALEDAGYILARGDRGYLVVDRKGGHSVLSRNTVLKKKEIEAFMAGVPLDRLPTVEEAKAIQAERRKTVSKSDGPADLSAEASAKAEAQKQGVEASKFLRSQEPAKAPEPVPAHADPQLEAIKKAIAKRQVEDLQKWDERHAHELRQLEFELDKEMANKLALRRADELQALTDLKESIRERTTGFKGVIAAIESRLSPQLGADRAKERRREIAALKRRQERERNDLEALLEQTKQAEIANLKARQALQRHDQQQKHIAEEERYIRDHEEAKRLRERIEAEQQELEKNESLREGPPPPKLGK